VLILAGRQVRTERTDRGASTSGPESADTSQAKSFESRSA
jgi:hypothetical protein